MDTARFAGRTWLLASGVAVLLSYGLVGYLLFGFSVVDAVYPTLSALLPNPSRDTVVQPGDLVVTFGEPDTLRPFT